MKTITPAKKRLIHGDLHLQKPGTKTVPETAEVSDDLAEKLIAAGAAVEVTAKSKKASG